MLDLSFNPLAKFYEAPIQLKANGGVFLVDDFGRQRMRPQDLLNRWIVPLESRIDYLTLHTGKKFQVPFDVLTVFATNLNPASLADEAFMRRIPYKIAIQDPTIDQFTRDLRAELPQARPALPSGDGRLPAAPPLRPDARGRCAPAIRAICWSTSPRCAATAASSRSSRANCSTPRAARTSSTTTERRPSCRRGSEDGGAAPDGRPLMSGRRRSSDRLAVGHGSRGAGDRDRAVLADVGRTCSAISSAPAT